MKNNMFFFIYVLFVTCLVNSGRCADLRELDEDSSSDNNNNITLTVTSTTKPNNAYDKDVNETSVANKKCREYAEMIYGHQINPSYKIYQSTKNTYCNVTNLIVGGKKAAPKEFPHMALLGTQALSRGKEMYWFCGGSLISERWILTAAHCANNIQLLPTEPLLHVPSYARLGAVNYLSTNTTDSGPIDYEIVQVKIHPNYTVGATFNDIALLRLSKDVDFSAHVRPICLNTDRSLNIKHALATGWGQTSYNGPTSADLLKVGLNIIPAEQCGQMLSAVSSNRFHNVDDASQLCAGNVKGGEDTCAGDSGGPLQIDHPKYACMHTQIGATSYGYRCAVKNTSGVYTRISNYIPWIEHIVWPKNQ